MTDKNKHISYTAADIDKYWRGELQPAEMHEMEKAALEDPLLAEAMEGIGEAIAARSFRSTVDVNELQRRLSARVRAGKRRPAAIPGWWKMAAAFIILAGGSAIAYRIVNRPSQQHLANNEAVTTPAQNRPYLQPADTASILPKKDSVIRQGKDDIAATETKIASVTQNTGEHRHHAKGKPGAGLHVAASPVDTAKKREALADNAAAEKKLMTSVIAKPMVYPPAIMSSNPQKDSDLVADAKVTGRSAMPNNFITGTVVDPQLRPIANASVLVSGSFAGTITDDKGNFYLVLPDSAQRLSIAATGFRTYDFNLGHNVRLPANRFTLQPAEPALNEVAVTGYGARTRRTVKAKDLAVKVIEAEPVVGWDVYNDYLEKNKRVPVALQSVHGDAVVAFVVSSNGVLKNFRVAEPLETSLDREAIRLVKDGPGWRPLHGKKAAVTLIVKF